jgi:hypothetical protein
MLLPLYGPLAQCQQPTSTSSTTPLDGRPRNEACRYGQVYQAARCRLRLGEAEGIPLRVAGGVAACAAGPSRGSAGTAGGPIAVWCSGTRRRLTDA